MHTHAEVKDDAQSSFGAIKLRKVPKKEDAREDGHDLWGGTQFTCFTNTQVQILTQKVLMQSRPLRTESKQTKRKTG